MFAIIRTFCSSLIFHVNSNFWTKKKSKVFQDFQDDQYFQDFRDSRLIKIFKTFKPIMFEVWSDSNQEKNFYVST